jgi:phosphoglycerate dehydrogenase-like enzyme
VAVCSRSFSNNLELRSKLLLRYKNVKFNDSGKTLSGDSLIDFLKGYDRAITALEEINESILTKLPDLKIIGKFGVGTDMIDFEALSRHGVLLGWTGGVNKRSVSELVISSSIALLHRTIFANSEVKNGKWYQVRGRQLSECTVGIIGCGNIGKDLVTLLKPFNCKVLVNDIVDYKDFYSDHNVTPVSLEFLLRKSDIVTLHLPLDSSTQNILDKEKLSLMKKNAILLNYARGGLIDEKELKVKLLNKDLAGAGVDVFEDEPLVDLDFSTIDNVFVTPHIGGSTEEAILAMGIAAIEGLSVRS